MLRFPSYIWSTHFRSAKYLLLYRAYILHCIFFLKQCTAIIVIVSIWYVVVFALFLSWIKNMRNIWNLCPIDTQRLHWCFCSSYVLNARCFSVWVCWHWVEWWRQTTQPIVAAWKHLSKEQRHTYTNVSPCRERWKYEDGEAE